MTNEEYQGFIEKYADSVVEYLEKEAISNKSKVMIGAPVVGGLGGAIIGSDLGAYEAYENALEKNRDQLKKIKKLKSKYKEKVESDFESEQPERRRSGAKSGAKVGLGLGALTSGAAAALMR